MINFKQSFIKIKLILIKFIRFWLKIQLISQEKDKKITRKMLKSILNGRNSSKINLFEHFWLNRPNFEGFQLNSNYFQSVLIKNIFFYTILSQGFGFWLWIRVKKIYKSHFDHDIVCNFSPSQCNCLSLVPIVIQENQKQFSKRGNDESVQN